MKKFIKIIEDSSEKTEQQLNSFLKRGYEIELISQNAIDRPGSYSGPKIILTTMIYLKNKKEI